MAMNYREAVADKLSKVGWSCGCISAVNSQGRTIWTVDAHCGDGNRYVVRSDDKLTAFLELERITHELTVLALPANDRNEIRPHRWGWQALGSSGR
jgi:hypothetical protein